MARRSAAERSGKARARWSRARRRSRRESASRAGRCRGPAAGRRATRGGRRGRRGRAAPGEEGRPRRPAGRRSGGGQGGRQLSSRCRYDVVDPAGDQPLPVAAGAQHRLDHLAHRLPPPVPLEHAVDARPHLGDGVGRREGEAAAGEHRQVEEVVADVGDPLGLDAVLGEELGEGGALVGAVEDDGVERQLAGARRERRGAAPGEDADLEPGALRQLERQAVADVEDLELLAPGAVDQAAVGEHAVDVEEQPLQGPRRGGRTRRSDSASLRTAPAPRGRGGGRSLRAARRRRRRRAR